MKHFLKNKSLKQNVFKVPSGYFEELPDKAFAYIGIEKKQDYIKNPTKKISMAVWSSVAAALIVGATISWQIVSRINAIKIENKYYLSVENSLIGFSTNTLTSFVDFEDVEQLNTVSDYLINEISEAELIDYRVDNY